MTSTYTSNQGLEKPATGDRSGTWGTMTNTNMDMLDRAISGVGALTLTGTTTTLTTSDGSASDGNYKVLVLGGSPSGTNTITLSPNDADKLYFVVNSTGQSVIFSQGTGANVTIANGAADIIYADGAGSGAAVSSYLANDFVFKTGDGAILNLQTSDTTVTASSVLGRLNFTAPDEASGTDAILLAASIAAISEGTFAADNNATKLSFMTGASEAAAEKMSISSVGNVTMKQTETGDDTPMTLLLQTGETDIAASDILGKIQFQAPDEAAGTDAILVAAEIAAASEGDFSSSNNATKLSFKTAASEAAAEKMSLSSGGNLTLPTDGVVIAAGVNSDVTLTHVHDTGLLLNSTMALQFNDASQYINAPSATVLDINATDEVEINATLADVNANLDVSGTYQGGGTMTTGGNIVIPDGGNIGSASDTDALSLSAAGALTATAGGAAATPAYAITNGSIGVNGMFVGSANTLSFCTAATERMKITSGGHLVAFADSTYDLGANATRWRQAYIDEIDIGANTSLAASAANAIFVGYAGGGSEYGQELKTDATTGTALYFLHSTTTACGSVTVGSSATAYNTSSDYRLKENVVDMSGAITRLKTLKPKRFSWIADENSELLDGFLAHEVDEVVPQAIHGEKDETKDVGTIKDADGDVLSENVIESEKEDDQTWEKTATENVYQGIDQAKLVPLLTGALQEAITKIESLEARVAALET